MNQCFTPTYLGPEKFPTARLKLEERNFTGVELSLLDETFKQGGLDEDLEQNRDVLTWCAVRALLDNRVQQQALAKRESAQEKMQQAKATLEATTTAAAKQEAQQLLFTQLQESTLPEKMDAVRVVTNQAIDMVKAHTSMMQTWSVNHCQRYFDQSQDWAAVHPLSHPLLLSYLCLTCGS